MNNNKNNSNYEYREQCDNRTYFKYFDEVNNQFIKSKDLMKYFFNIK